MTEALFPAASPAAIAVDDGRRQLRHATLEAEASQLADCLRHRGVRVLATLRDNSIGWVLVDLATQLADVVHVPLPAFFTREQMLHALASAGCDALLIGAVEAAGALAALGISAPTEDWRIAGESHRLLRLAHRRVELPAGTAKVTFTSGSTGEPKGVCLGGDAMNMVARGVAEALRPQNIQRHLCALPLPVLLENVAGMMAPLQQGAACVVPPLAELGLHGSSSFDPAAFQRAMLRYRPDSLILLPQMLRAWAAYLHAAGQRPPDGLRFVAVGGAAVGERALLAARALGIPAYEGYGLSEGASVQTLNVPGADRPGTAGRALPHARVRAAIDGELEIAGSHFLGYVGESAVPRTWWPTGDLGHIDEDGFVHVEGRKKNVLITAFGRNVAPEWVETALRSEPAVLQAVVMGDGQPELRAVLWPTQADLPDAVLQAAVDATNRTLPDYARIGRWVRGAAPFSAEGGQATANGRPRREAIRQLHARALNLDLQPSA